MKYQSEHLVTFPNQIQFALTEFEKSTWSPENVSPKNIVIAGLGGSGIAGRIISNYFQGVCPFPIEIVSDYDIPAYCNKDTLLICSSYSGNTEETLSCFEQGVKKGCNIICISSGGKISELAEKNEFYRFKAEPGYQPRMALGYSLTYLIQIISALSNVRYEFETILEKLQNLSYYQDVAASLEEELSSMEGTINILADSPYMAVATRFQQQLNENAKLNCFVHPVPEMCHNVIEAITEENNRNIYFILNSGTNARNNARFDFLRTLIDAKKCAHLGLMKNVLELEHLLEEIYILDWVSLMLADRRNIVSSNIPNILELKDYMSRA